MAYTPAGYRLTLNYPIQSCMADVLEKELRKAYKDIAYAQYYGLFGPDYLTNGRPKMAADSDTFYVVVDVTGAKRATYSNEPAAIAAAENQAALSPGQTFYVTKTITKSVVVKPAITTRL